MVTYVKIDWSHLPQRVWDKVCSHYGANGFALDPETEFWVHKPDKGEPCGKPRLPLCVLMCDECDIPFVAEHRNDVKASFFGALCNDCKP